jgi:membrane protein DedA with SNARE-associated domain
MNLEQFLSQVLQLTANFDPRTAAFLFLLCAIGEIGMGIPYVLESVWLLAGYQLGRYLLGMEGLSPVQLVGLWLAALAGRQTGSLALYSIARLSSSPLARLYQKCTSSRFWPKTKINTKAFSRINFTSPFSIAYGRLIGLRFPLIFMLAYKKKLAAAMLGVLLSSVIWDAIYITLGATVGRTTALKPVQMLLVSIAGLTLLYLIVFIVRRLLRRSKPTSQ